jgi:dTDP-glucose pyrophosphorylase
MNILLLLAGKNRANTDDNGYPMLLAEIEGKPIIQLQIEFAQRIERAKIFAVIRNEYCQRFQIDSVINLLDPSAVIVKASGDTRGAACSALLAINHIENESPLLLLNTDELVMVDYSKVIEDFVERDLDAGAITFSSVHPRYSFLKIDESSGLVTEAAEKRPISRNASAGFYYFKKGKYFVSAAKEMIRKRAEVEGNFYISTALNEMILNHLRVGVFQVESANYIPLKSDANFENLSKNIGKFLNAKLQAQ